MDKGRLLDAPLSLVDEEGTTHSTMESSGRDTLVSIRDRAYGVELLSRLAATDDQAHDRPRQRYQELFWRLLRHVNGGLLTRSSSSLRRLGGARSGVPEIGEVEICLVEESRAFPPDIDARQTKSQTKITVVIVVVRHSYIH